MVALLSSRTSVRAWPDPEGVADIPPQTVQALGLDDEEEDDEGTEHHERLGIRLSTVWGTRKTPPTDAMARRITMGKRVRKMAPSTEPRTDPSPPMMISLPPSPSCRPRRVPRESLDAPENLPKEGPRQVAFGQGQGP
jgi:hypothetical protein